MNTKLLNKIISVFLIFVVFSNSILPSLAQEVTPLPDAGPTVEPTITPTITLTPTPTDSTASNLDEQVVTEDSNTQEGTIIVSPDGITATNSADLVTIDTSSTDTLTTTIDNTNNAEIDRNIDTTNNTGENVLTDNIVLEGGTSTIVTGDAESIQNITTVVNTNVVAQSAAIVLQDVYGNNTGDIDLSSIAPCYTSGNVITPSGFTDTNTGNNVKIINADSTDETLVVRNNNTADIQNDITLTSNTGDNSAINNISSGTSVQTGDAYSSLNLFTMANTNLVGNCYFYGVINLFGSQNGDIIFPYEMDFLQNELTPLVFKPQTDIVNTGEASVIDVSSTTTTNTAVKNTNTADVNENLSSAATTGQNSMIDTINFNTIGSIVTGDATGSKNVLDMINNNYTFNNFFVLLINRYGNWNGEVIGLDSSYLLVPQASNPNAPTLSSSAIVNSGDFLDLSLQTTNSNTVVVENTNNLTVVNNVSLNANTGRNEAGRFNASILTGDAQTQANIFTMGNTNITGDSWFFAVINIFDDFVGNIIFPRPELAISKTVDQPSHNAGDNFTYTISYGNFGNTYGNEVVISDTLPANLTLVAASAGAEISGNTVRWSIGKLEPGQMGSVSIMVRTNSDISSIDISNTATISGSRMETTTENNSSTAMVHIFARVSGNSSESLTSSVASVAVSSPLGGSISPAAAWTTQSATGSVKGMHQTATKAKSKINGKSAGCGTNCQVEALKSDQSILTILGLLLVLLVVIRKQYATS